ncbi:MAG: hypothetical protein AAF355_13305 [Myxococcota bacterium]
MAKARKKSKQKTAPSAVERSGSKQHARTESPRSAAETHSGVETDARMEARAKPEPGAASKAQSQSPNDRRVGLAVDPNLPRPDGPRVSEHGGLYFVGTIFALIVLAIIAQVATQN